jgi:hypothetical protein
VKCLAGKRLDNRLIIDGMAVTGNVTPTIVALIDPNMEIKLIIKANLGWMLNKNTDTEMVAAINKTDANKIDKKLDANGMFIT